MRNILLMISVTTMILSAVGCGKPKSQDRLNQGGIAYLVDRPFFKPEGAVKAFQTDVGQIVFLQTTDRLSIVRAVCDKNLTNPQFSANSAADPSFDTVTWGDSFSHVIDGFEWAPRYEARITNQLDSQGYFKVSCYERVY